MIKNFQNFYHDNLLHESLNTPVEFYMTDDTQLPNRIYAAFKMDDDTYGMSLEVSDHKGIYLLKMYRVLAKKPRKWSFKKPSHIRPALSTLLKFIEASVPFIKPQLKGIICQVAGQNADKYIRFAERILKKTYITSFKVLPTTKSPDKKIYPWENIFVSRVGISPKAVFSDPKFSSYDFPDGILTHEVAEVIKPKLKEKQSVKTEPSKKYKFGNIEVDEITIDSEVFDMITKIEKEYTPENTAIAKDSFDTSGLTDKNKASLEKYATQGQKKKIAKLYGMVNKDVASVLSALVQTYKETNPNEVIMEVGDIQFVLNQTFKGQDYMSLRNYLEDIGIISSENGEDINIDVLKSTLEKYKKSIPKKTSLNSIMNVITQFEKTYIKKSKGKTSNKKSGQTSQGKKLNTFKTNILPEQLISTLPGVGIFDYDEVDFRSVKKGDNVLYEYIDVMVNKLSDDLGYEKAIRNHKNYYYVREYTGSEYTHINSTIREAFGLFTKNITSFKNTMISAKEKLSEEGMIGKIVSVFDDLEPLPESLWVYRNTSLPEDVWKGLKSGEDFVDPAVMSTSIRSSLDFSGVEGHRFRIFLPKGSRVIPVLDSSAHKNEDEVILPPLSILKIIRLDEYSPISAYTSPSDRSYLITCVFVGSVFKNFRDQYNTWVKSHLSESTEKTQLLGKKKSTKSGYDPSEKFGNGTDAETLKMASTFAKSMKMKGK